MQQTLLDYLLDVKHKYMNENKKIEILAIINRDWDNYENKIDLAKEIENGYIFGPLGENEHYTISEIMELIKEVELEKNPLPVIEETENIIE